MADKKTEYDAYVKAQKDKERDTKNLKKLELQMKAALDSLANIKLQHEKIIAFKESQPKNDGSLFEKRQTLTLEVEGIKRTLTSQVCIWKKASLYLTTLLLFEWIFLCFLLK